MTGRRIPFGPKLHLAIMISMFAILLCGRAQAEEPRDFIKKSVDEVLGILRDPAYQHESAQKEQDRKLRAAAERMFSVQELSKRTLARNWKRLTPAQKKEFESLFPRLLEDTYISRLQSYTNERVVYGKQTMRSPRKAEVETTIVSSSRDIPIKYRLILNSGSWKVYDIVIEGVSLVKNYRSQFKEILRKKSPEDLLSTLREKVGKNGGPS